MYSLRLRKVPNAPPVASQEPQTQNTPPKLS